MKAVHSSEVRMVNTMVEGHVTRGQSFRITQPFDILVLTRARIGPTSTCQEDPC